MTVIALGVLVGEATINVRPVATAKVWVPLAVGFMAYGAASAYVGCTEAATGYSLLGIACYIGPLIRGNAPRRTRWLWNGPLILLTIWIWQMVRDCLP